MRNAIKEVLISYPGLDLMDLLILLEIAENPGYSIREVAEFLKLDEKSLRQKVTQMGAGRKEKFGMAYHLITDDRNPADRRKRSLALTPAGVEIVEKLNQ